MTGLRIPDGFLKIQIPESHSSPTESAWEAGGVCLLDVLGPGAQGSSAPVLTPREFPGHVFFLFFFFLEGGLEGQQGNSQKGNTVMT